MVYNQDYNEFFWNITNCQCKQGVMIAQSFEITGHISNSIRSRVFHHWFCSLVVSCLARNHKVGGSIPCQAKATLLTRSKIVLFPLFRLQL